MSKQMLKQMLKTDAKTDVKTDVKKTNVNKELMLVKSSSVLSFSIRCLALTTCYPLLILIFLRGLRPCVLDCSVVLFCSPTCPNPYWLCFVYSILLADHGPCLFFVFLRYLILIAFPLQLWLHERAWLLR